MENSLNERIRKFLGENISDFGQEEVDHVKEILGSYDSNLSNLSDVDKTLILRLIVDESELCYEVTSINTSEKSDPFADL